MIMTTILCVQQASSSLENWVAISTIIAGIAAAIGIGVSVRLYRNQQNYSQKQLILPVWEYISNLREIDSENPITPDVIKAINTLELIAVLCRNEIIDEKIIKQTFKNQFKKHYKNIKDCGNLPGFKNKTGQDLIDENKNVKKFYKEL